ncbi:MAG: transcription antitermination factor NusB [Candidatus Faecalibacterium intestinavium]|uniref:Transcription antitermination protein NusB n=1 Tax=Candidatus Faecalibacterium intestinavium TaxID=2838580 RepID=A0A9E2KIY8_9FIRM|nr:transcription antitermination factor NusB [Candidatus Faecalibacterium intestinavium]
MENLLPRRQARENAFLLAFSQTFGDVPLHEALQANRECDEDRPVDAFGAYLLRTYYEHSAEVDDQISAHLRGWTIARLPRVTVTVLRLAIAEMLFGDENKPGVAINEAVELTKKYGAEEDYQFVNGLLGSVAREAGLVDETETGETEMEPVQP